MADQAAVVPLETGALWNLIDRAEHGAGTAQEARVLRRCVRAIVGRAQRAEARVAELEAELEQLRAAQRGPADDLTREIEDANHDPRWGAAPSYRCYMTRHRDCQPNGPEAGCTCGCHTEEAS